MDSGLMVVLQQTAKHRVVARSQAGKSPIAKSVNLHRQNPAGEREHTEGSPIEKEVDTILGGPCKAKKKLLHSQQICPRSKVPTSGRGVLRKRMFLGGYSTETKRRRLHRGRHKLNWVHQTQEDALVIMTKIASNLVHRILVDNENVVNILYWHTYQKIGLTRANLSPRPHPYTDLSRVTLSPQELSSWLSS